MEILVLPSSSRLVRRGPCDLMEDCNPSPSCSGRNSIHVAGLRSRWGRFGRVRRRTHFVVCCQGNDELKKEEEEEEEDEENDEENETERKGYWEMEEGKQKLDEIMEMQELVNEAEKLQKEAEDGKEKTLQMQQELARRAKEQAEKRRIAETMFKLGQQAYSKGVYDKAVQFLETAVENVSKGTNLGGDVQIWLAMAYEANNQHDACINLYKRLESSHPSKTIQRQAADLRYILEAPKLKISSEERVTIPLINAYSESSQKTWTQMVQERKQRVSGNKKPPKKAEDVIEWNPLKWEKSPYFWVAVTLWLTLAGISLMFQD